ncbi:MULTISPECIES: hypothetical protein [unclassified Curtobacterium]|uniref:hypothetical protein n=1 Tax=unclassified Curtobacterium TaxID=257496 RepID=UPI000DA6FA98|nr:MULTISPECIES: hypothetical protein [unclassified Curtobacterium]PZE23691.1 hypothetical protein DEI86_13885 [Curtobacterium sp. MCBD17_028]PZE77612.1 hypothetical protein DEI82_01955 [Curtobacterium sp. MCBD17_019]PZF60051.1 hypothetical protein DEI81_13540 [Curtobacterium sp. MCBD17_013]PZF62214.1 hypothetical protein DEI92_01555 [Curtobacterium sp. MCBD17_034]PZM33027.1 hypothetical protein DEI90_15080 [Curtobacterium sp. MCBD17_031]
MHERGQTKYQVRFGWGAAGAGRIAADAHVLVWVDVLPTSEVRAVLPLLPAGPEVVHAGLADADLVAERVLGLQAALGDRCVVAVVGAGVDDDATAGGAAPSLEDAGEAVADPAGAPEPAVEDLLAAGAVVDALAARGIDHTSPEAAAACAAYTGLRRAVRHLLTASVSATMLDAVGRHDLVEAALAAPATLRTLRAGGAGGGREHGRRG